MDSASMNPYEQQLYTVFKTFDVENEEALNKSAVLDLCDALQLEDRGAALVGTLFERSSDRVTFTQFRNGLLSVLSGDGAAPAERPGPAEPAPAEPAPAAPSDEDSSGREVAPKFVFGSKKYGRRSRPQRGPDAHAPRAASGSRLDAARASRSTRCRRSASAMETRDLDSNTDDDAAPDAFDHERRIDRDEALALCRDLRMDGIDGRLVDRVFEDSRAGDTTTVGRFFDRLNASLTSSIEGAPGPGPGDDPEADDAAVPSELVADAWERAGVPRPRRLLLELGFGAAAVRPPDLERALDAELAALAEPPDERDARALVLAAARALAGLRLRRARRRADAAAAERDKLRADVAEAHRRARLLAQDVDEAHARLEAELAAELRRAEARHAEAARQAAAEAAAERERAAARRALLEAEVARRGEAEARLRAEAEAERARAERLEARAAAAEGRAAAAEREAARLAEAEAEAEAERGAAPQAGADGAEGAAARALAAQLAELRREAQRLRDRNDELCGALEARAGSGAGPGPDSPAEGTAGGDLSAELRSLMTPETLEECDSAPASIEQKVLDYREAARRLRAIFDAVEAAGAGEGAALADVRERVRKVSESVILVGRPGPRGAHADPAPEPRGAHAGPAPRDVSVQAAPAAREASAQTDTAPTDADLESIVDELRKELTDAENQHENDKLKLTDLVRELEASLEALREEYERCEEYWAGKLRDERSAHEAELRAGDERLAELVARVADYERRYAPPPPLLPPIEERAALEAQVAELEREGAQAAAALAAREAELRRALERLAQHERRRARDPREPAYQQPARDTQLPEPGAGGAGGAGRGGPGCACGARAGAARAARAEAALRRLTARLRAADLLVKELYVENCHLAHRPPP